MSSQAHTADRRPVLRVEDPPLLTGTARFVDDLDPVDTVHARFLRSPAAHATIESLDLEAARMSAGVHAAFGAGDLSLGPLHPPMTNPLAFSPSRPLLGRRGRPVRR